MVDRWLAHSGKSDRYCSNEGRYATEENASPASMLDRNVLISPTFAL
jgi:hypothetical protein